MRNSESTISGLEALLESCAGSLLLLWLRRMRLLLLWLRRMLLLLL